MEILGGSALNKKGMIWKVNSSSSSIGCGFGAIMKDQIKDHFTCKMARSLSGMNKLRVKQRLVVLCFFQIQKQPHIPQGKDSVQEKVHCFPLAHLSVY
ncbi:hypothetical protein AT5G07175 [Arabidopsis thaliana]|uniref:Uncharacterized protein n=1 Tax=Arabidopsis thaliana TaxID=3702 RepID=A0A1P8BBB8_ARATH|nr:uncharacterized protein AT5G07175 [Arabidopsis thaliana]ANM68872.1 hypothetical protein AT5G07175 [Arabidopsis thaliana]|eukprot:NP_001330590.1 hypothetical protein AT5G07175 [Arabidopsis thaliana]